MRALVFVALTLPAVLGLASPAAGQADTESLPPNLLTPANLPRFGNAVTTSDPGASSAVSDNLAISESNVSINDSALPRSTLRLRLDLGYDMPRPTRAEFFQAKGGLPGSPGPPLREPRINSYQDLASYVEFAPVSFFSAFVEAPVRWINPQANENTYGYGDTSFGFKLCTWDTSTFLATFQLRTYAPTAVQAGLGTNHWTIEPALLTIWRPYDNIMVEGDVRYWAPVGGTDFAGDIVRYGVGVSIGQVNQGIWIKPVIEAVAWTVLNGQTLVVGSPDAYFVERAAGQTIANGYAGLRVGLGQSFDCYAGYGRCFTGNTWTRDFVRLEVRLFY